MNDYELKELMSGISSINILEDKKTSSSVLLKSRLININPDIKVTTDLSFMNTTDINIIICSDISRIDSKLRKGIRSIYITEEQANNEDFERNALKLMDWKSIRDIERVLLEMNNNGVIELPDDIHERFISREKIRNKIVNYDS